MKIIKIKENKQKDIFAEELGEASGFMGEPSLLDLPVGALTTHSH